MPIDYNTLKPMNAGQKLNPLGAHLLHGYYTGSLEPSARRKIVKRLYTVNDPKDIPLIMSCESNDEIYGIIVVAGGRHRTPVIVKGKDVVILESLGTSKSRVGNNSVAQISIAIDNVPGEKHNIYTPAGNRQIDSVSCGTDAFLAMKEALRLGEGLFDQIKAQNSKDLSFSISDVIDPKEKVDPFYDRSGVRVAQFEELPAEIVKYSQSISAVERLASKDTLIKKNSSTEDERETVLDYALRHKSKAIVEDKAKPSKDVGIMLFGKEEVVRLKGTKETVTNGAIDQRRAKHQAVMSNMLKSLSSKKIDEIILESSGVNLILRNIHRLPESLMLAIESSSGQEPLDVMIREYIDDEKHKQRDAKLSVSPEGRHSLASVAKAAYQERRKYLDLLKDLQVEIKSLPKITRSRDGLCVTSSVKASIVKKSIHEI